MVPGASGANVERRAADQARNIAGRSSCSSVCDDGDADGGVDGSGRQGVTSTLSSRAQDGFVQLRSILRREKQSRADSDRHPMEDM